MIKDASLRLISEYARNHPGQTLFKDISFTVDTTINCKTRTLRGKSFSKLNKNRIILLRDVPDIIELALAVSFFECLGTVYKQDRGAIIGGHASGAICFYGSRFS